MPFNFDEYRAECAGYDDWHLQKEFEKYTRMMASSSAGTDMAVFTFGLSLLALLESFQSLRGLPMHGFRT